jgi:hypothetical protein
MFLKIDAALGARRGEVLALRWSDVEDGRVVIGRSLCQTKSGVEFKSTKTEEIRVLGCPCRHWPRWRLTDSNRTYSANSSEVTTAPI